MYTISCKDGFFLVSTVHREDLEEIGFDTSNIDDEVMGRLAKGMSELYVESGAFEQHLEAMAKLLGKKMKKEGVCF